LRGVSASAPTISGSPEIAGVGHIPLASRYLFRAASFAATI
jgi:hypothetical protein